jgi:type II secretory pathway pseudopilin PulG
MIILVVVVLAIVAIAASTLISSAKSTSGTVTNTTAKITESLAYSCIRDADCSGLGSGYTCVQGECSRQ